MKSTVYSIPESASAPIKVYKKRGRKGTSIRDAFQNIPVGIDNAVPAAPYAAEYKIALVSLQQTRRHDNESLRTSIGKVHVRRNKETGELMVWRESTPVT